MLLSPISLVGELRPPLLIPTWNRSPNLDLRPSSRVREKYMTRSSPLVHHSLTYEDLCKKNDDIEDDKVESTVDYETIHLNFPALYCAAPATCAMSRPYFMMRPEPSNISLSFSSLQRSDSVMDTKKVRYTAKKHRDEIGEVTTEYVSGCLFFGKWKGFRNPFKSTLKKTLNILLEHNSYKPHYLPPSVE